MRQRPQYLLQALADEGHPVYFTDRGEPRHRRMGGVTVINDLDEVGLAQPLVYVHFAPVRELLEGLDRPLVIYDILDDLSIYDADEAEVPPHRRVRYHHPALMEQAAVVMVSSPVLAQRHRAERDDVVVVPNGVDYSRFSRPAARPGDLVDDGRPVVGYTGAVSYWLDFELVEEVVRLRPDYRFLFVGPVDPRVEQQAERLAALPNVELLGERPPDAIPGYVQVFDAGAVWFRSDHLTEAVTPLKMYEYLAAGVGVVATPLPACVEQQEVVTTDDPAAFASALDQAVDTRHDLVERAARRRQGELADWSQRLRPLCARLTELGIERYA